MTHLVPQASEEVDISFVRASNHHRCRVERGFVQPGQERPKASERWEKRVRQLAAKRRERCQALQMSTAAAWPLAAVAYQISEHTRTWTTLLQSHFPECEQSVYPRMKVEDLWPVPDQAEVEDLASYRCYSCAPASLVQKAVGLGTKGTHMVWHGIECEEFAMLRVARKSNPWPYQVCLSAVSTHVVSGSPHPNREPQFGHDMLAGFYGNRIRNACGATESHVSG